MSPDLDTRLQALPRHQRALLQRALEGMGDALVHLTEDHLNEMLDEIERVQASLPFCELQDAASGAHEAFIDELLDELLPLCPAVKACVLESERSGEGMTRELAMRYRDQLLLELDYMAVPLSRVPPSLMARVRERRQEKRALIEREMNLYDVCEYEACLRVEDREGMLHVREHADT